MNLVRHEPGYFAAGKTQLTGGAHQGREDALGDRADIVQAVAIVPVEVFLDHQGPVPDGVEALGRWGGDRPLGGGRSLEMNAVGLRFFP